MKNLLLSTLISLITLSASAQQFKDLDNIPLKSDADFKKAEPTVKDCVKYILGHPQDDKDGSAKSAAKFIISWMTGTPDFSFNVDNDVAKYITSADPGTSNAGLMSVLMASMIKVVFDKPEITKDPKAMKIASYRQLAEYCGNSKNKVVLTDNLKKLVEANKENKLTSVLDVSSAVSK